MPMIHSAKIVELAQATDARKALIEAVDVTGIETCGENLFVATYIRPERTKGGIIRPESNIKEDEFQGNVGLVLQVGDGILNEDDRQAMLHQWVMFGYNDGLRFRYNDVPCRFLPVERVRGTVKDPSKVL